MTCEEDQRSTELVLLTHIVSYHYVNICDCAWFMQPLDCGCHPALLPKVVSQLAATDDEAKSKTEESCSSQL
jgi:hypothetical protein